MTLNYMCFGRNFRYVVIALIVTLQITTWENYISKLKVEPYRPLLYVRIIMYL